jgi:hypothetical protein
MRACVPGNDATAPLRSTSCPPCGALVQSQTQPQRVVDLLHRRLAHQAIDGRIRCVVLDDDGSAVTRLGPRGSPRSTSITSPRRTRCCPRRRAPRALSRRLHPSRRRPARTPSRARRLVERVRRRSKRPIVMPQLHAENTARLGALGSPNSLRGPRGFTAALRALRSFGRGRALGLGESGCGRGGGCAARWGRASRDRLAARDRSAAAGDR